MTGRPFRLLHYSYGDEPADTPEDRAAREQGFALWPLDYRTQGVSGGDGLGAPPGVPAWPDQLAQYGNGPCIVVYYGPQTGAGWTVHTARGEEPASGPDIPQFQFGMMVAAALVKELAADPSRPSHEILAATANHAVPLPVRNAGTTSVEGPAMEDAPREPLGDQ